MMPLCVMALDPTLQLAANERLNNFHAFFAIVEAWNVAEILAAGLVESLSRFVTDFVNGFQTVYPQSRD